MKPERGMKARSVSKNVEERVVDLIRERFASEEGQSFREDAHFKALLLKEAGLLYESKDAYRRILAADPDDREASEALLDIEMIKQ